MTKDIKDLVRSCDKCREMQTKQLKEIMKYITFVGMELFITNFTNYLMICKLLFRLLGTR